MPTVSLAAHAGLPFHDPLAARDVEAAIGALRPPPGGSVLETGCGRGELLAAARAAALEPERRCIAGPDDWAAYEEGLAANAERTGGEDALAYARAIRERRALPGGTTTLGFALVLLRG